MYVGVLGAFRNLPDLIDYTPKAGSGKRSIELFRSNTEMVGAMIVCMGYSSEAHPVTDYVVSAAPNLLYKQNTREYKLHTSGDNDGTQIHSERFLATQLEALFEALKGVQETPRGSYTQRGGLSGGEVRASVDVFIEKGSMCTACSNTWALWKTNMEGLSIDGEYRI